MGERRRSRSRGGDTDRPASRREAATEPRLQRGPVLLPTLAVLVAHAPIAFTQPHGRSLHWLG